jgi:hypothetical protein
MGASERGRGYRRVVGGRTSRMAEASGSNRHVCKPLPPRTKIGGRKGKSSRLPKLGEERGKAASSSSEAGRAVGSRTSRLRRCTE